MHLILGSGLTYDFLADKLLTDYPDEVIQISPAYAGPRQEDSHTKWYELRDEVDEVTLLLGGLERLKNTVFTKVFLCIPEIDMQQHTLVTSHGLIDLLKRHLVPYLYLTKQLVSYKTKFSVVCETHGQGEFELDMLCSIIRPLVSTSLQGTGTILEFYGKNILAQKSLEQWYKTTWTK